MTQNQTNALLLDAAISYFGRFGLDGASTRQIALAAKTTMSAITYHYGGKEGLYLAAAEKIARVLASEFGLAVQAESGVTEGDRSGARDAIQRVVAKIANQMLNDERADYSRFLLREQMQPTEAFTLIYDAAIGNLLEQVSRLVSIAADIESRAARIMTLLILAMAMSPRSQKSSMLRQLDASSFNEEAFEFVRVILASSVDAILNYTSPPAAPIGKLAND